MKEHPDYKGIYCDELGNIYSTLKSNPHPHITYYEQPKLLKGHHHISGYITYNLHRYGMKTGHRIVAETLIPNHDNLPQVNHINEDKSDNRKCNLEWITARGNITHSKANQYRVINTQGEVVIVDNVWIWCEKNNINGRSLKSTLRTKKYHKSGYILERVE